MKIRLFFLSGLIMSGSLGCSLGLKLPDFRSSGPANPEQSSDILFRDDFSDLSSGWDRFRDANGMTDYQNGAYHIHIDISDFAFWSNPGLGDTLPNDVRVKVQATKIGGPDVNDYGIICRYQDNMDTADFYQFVITSDGYAGIVLVENSLQEVLSDDGVLQPYDAINQGEETNDITVECIGSTLTLFVNGEVLTSIVDTSLQNGDVGLIAGSYKEPGVSIRFDNFVVSRP